MKAITQHSDEELLKGLLDRDTDLTHALYKEVWQKASVVLKRKGASKEDVEDIVQDSIVAVYTNLRKNSFRLIEDTKLTTYILQICKYQWYNKIRKKDNINLSLEEEIIDNVDDFNAQKHIETIERNKLIAEAIEKLGEKCRDLLRLYYWENLSMEKIGEKLNMKANSAKNGKYRCMQSLRDILLKLKRNQIV